MRYGPADAIDVSGLRHALVIQLRHHGNVLLFSPVFQVLKNHGAHLETDALVYHGTCDMLTLHPAVSQVHTVDRKWRTLGAAAQLRADCGCAGPCARAAI